MLQFNKNIEKYRKITIFLKSLLPFSNIWIIGRSIKWWFRGEWTYVHHSIQVILATQLRQDSIFTLWYRVHPFYVWLQRVLLKKVSFDLRLFLNNNSMPILHFVTSKYLIIKFDRLDNGRGHIWREQFRSILVQCRICLILYTQNKLLHNWRSASLLMYYSYFLLHARQLPKKRFENPVKIGNRPQ